ncbi:MAG: putative sigma factor [Ilumatobacteraceae bacterium]|nr:putative sigma factor [Ilumatobacteraceae bacterium]
MSQTDIAVPSLGEQAQLRADVISRIAFRITRSRSASQDVTQEVMLRVCRCGGFDASRGTFDAWVQMLTQSAAIDWIRREAAHERRQGRVGAIHVSTMPAVEDEVGARWRAAGIRTAVESLPEDERVVVSMAYFDDLTYREVAQRLGLPEGTVKTRIRRALSRLATTQSQLKSEEVRFVPIRNADRSELMVGGQEPEASMTFVNTASSPAS